MCRKDACTTCDTALAPSGSFHRTAASADPAAATKRAGVIYARVSGKVAGAPRDGRGTVLLAASVASDRAATVLVCHACYQAVTKEVAARRKEKGGAAAAAAAATGEGDGGGDGDGGDASDEDADLPAPPRGLSATPLPSPHGLPATPLPPSARPVGGNKAGKGAWTPPAAQVRDQLVAVADPVSADGFRRYKVRGEPAVGPGGADGAADPADLREGTVGTASF